MQKKLLCTLSKMAASGVGPAITCPMPMSVTAVPMPVEVADVKHKKNHLFVKNLLESAETFRDGCTTVFRSPDGQLALSAPGESRALTIIDVSAKNLIKVTKKGGPRPVVLWEGAQPAFPFCWLRAF